MGAHRCLGGFTSAGGDGRNPGEPASCRERFTAGRSGKLGARRGAVPGALQQPSRHPAWPPLPGGCWCFGGRGGWQRLVAVSWSGGGCAGGAAGWESCREPQLPARPGDALPGFHTCRRLGELQRFNGENGDLAGAGSLPPLSIFS